MKKEPDYWGKLWDRVKEQSGYTAYTNSTGYLLGQAITKSIGDFFSRMSEVERQERQQAALRHALSDTETTEELLKRVKAITEIEYPTTAEFLKDIYERFVTHARKEKHPLSHIDLSPDPLVDLLMALYQPDRITPPPPPKDRQSITQAVYRDELRAFINQYPQPDKILFAFQYLAMRVLRSVCFNLPSYLQDEGELDSNSPFTLPLCDVLPDPVQAITDLFSIFSDDEIAMLPTVQDIGNQLMQNTLILSGLPLEPQSLTSPKIIRPENYKGTDIIYHYTRGTPFLDFYETPVPFSIPDSLLSEHRLVIASTGTGKSQFIQADAYHYLQREHRPGIVIIDSQGTMLPQFERLDCWRDDLIVIDPEDSDPPALSLFAMPKRFKTYDERTKAIILSDTLKLFNFLFSALGIDLTGNQNIFFSFAIRLILTIPEANIFTLHELLNEQPKTPQASQFWPYIERMDQAARSFFETRFFNKGYTLETKGALANRLYGIVSLPAFSRMLTAKENKLDLFDAINSGKTILVNTAKTFLGDASPIFGRYFIAATLGAAFQRITLPKPYPLTLLYIDEAREYMSGDKIIEDLFTQARKFNLATTVAYQSLSQLKELKQTLLTNTTTKMVAGIEPNEAGDLAESMRTRKDFILSLRKHKHHTEFGCFVKTHTPTAVRLSIPFRVVEDAPKMSAEEHRALRQSNRERYGIPRSANVNHENSLSQTHKAPSKVAANEVPRPHPTRVSTTPAPDPHAGIDD